MGARNLLWERDEGDAALIIPRMRLRPHGRAKDQEIRQIRRGGGGVDEGRGRLRRPGGGGFGRKTKTRTRATQASLPYPSSAPAPTDEILWATSEVALQFCVDLGVNC
jgi:hypothetical protein